MTRVASLFSLVFLLAVTGSGCSPTADDPAFGAGGASAPSRTGGRGATPATGGSGPTGTGGSGGVASGSGGSSAGGSGVAGSPGGGAGGSSAGSGGSGAPADGGSDTGSPPGSAPPAGVVPSAACSAGAAVPGPDGYQSIMNNGRMRRFLVRVPRSYDGRKPLALIFAFHGGNANGMSFETRIASIRTAIGERAIYLYPDGQAAGDMITWARDHKDDLAFVDTILGWAKDKLCFDTARVLAMGQSSGAYFSHTVGCHRAGVFRAVASNGGGARQNEFVACNGQPAAAWISNGAADGPHLPWARKAREEWVKINGCTMAAPAKTDPAPCVSYQSCKSGFPVHYCENPGGHDIPGYMPMGLANFFLGNFDK